MTFKAITSQKQLNDVLAKRIKRVENKYKSFLSPDEVNKVKADYEKKLNDNTAPKNLTEKLSELSTQLETYKKDNARLKEMALKSNLASEYGLPKQFESRIIGATEEEMRADAQTLAEVFKKSSNTILPMGSTEPVEEKNDMKNMLKNLKGE